MEKDSCAESVSEEARPSEDLAKIPLLERSDIRREIEPIILEERKIEDTKLIYHKIETNGVSYSRLLFDISEVQAGSCLPMSDIFEGGDRTGGYWELFLSGAVYTDRPFDRRNRASYEYLSECHKSVERKVTFEIKGKAMRI